jgi:deazaflavin-dependent oxidoreductase (nitroreductase family)
MADSPNSALHDFNSSLISEFRANAGRVSGPFANAPLLVLTTTGARSGRTHTVPVVYTRDGDRLVIIASKGGAPVSPAWYHNLKANPHAVVEIGDETFDVTAEITAGAERDRLFRQQAAAMPNFADYQNRTSRRIPVVALTRVG